MPDYRDIIRWAFGIVFITLGVLNAVLVHPVPGAFYLLLSLMYFPPVIALVRRRTRLAVPFSILVIAGLVVLWGTLAVTDLADMAGL